MIIKPLKNTLILLAISSFTQTTLAQSSSTLVFASDLIRHGARTTIHQIPSLHYPSLWSDSNIPPGQLTQYGWFEEKTNGQYFKQHYKNLLPMHYDTSKICIRTDGVNRTIMSAIAIASRLYPKPLQYDIQSVPKQTDRLLQPSKSVKKLARSAPGWQQQWQRSPLGYAFYQQLYQKKLISSLCKPTGKQNYQGCFNTIAPLADSIKTLENYCSHTTAHCSAKKILGLSQTTINKVKRIDNWLVMHSFIPTHDKGFRSTIDQYKTLGLRSGCNLVSEVIHNMQAVINHKTAVKYVLYSGHDSTILTTLSYLISENFAHYKTSPLKGNPDFAANLSFRLYRAPQNTYQVKILYRNSYALDTPQQVIVNNSFKDFKQRYFNQQCLAAIKPFHRCDYL